MSAKIATTPAQHARLRRALVRLLRAEADHDGMGGGHPEDWPLIETELKSARAVFWGLFKRAPETAKRGEPEQ